jgi:small GTP-binding protein
MNRRRSGSFHHDDDEDNEDVQFLTPQYGGDDFGPEPVDFSKLNFDSTDVPDYNGDEYSQEEEEEQEELIMGRGRSRSRSVHANDDDNESYIPEGVNVKHSVTPINPENIKLVDSENKKYVPVDRTGPLQHREVVALQKVIRLHFLIIFCICLNAFTTSQGLEEATQSLGVGGGNTREDEEERMAADAEKRKRMLQASHQLSSNSGEPARRIKLLLLGDSGVGKSSLINRWTLDSFSPSLTSTVGVNFKSKKIHFQGELMQVQVWDTAGQENFHKITTSYYKGAQGIMLVYDVSDLKSLENVQYWIKNIKAHASDSVQVVLVGNKIDLRTMPETASRCVDSERGREIAKRFSVPFFETSAKDSSHVDEAYLTLVSQIIEMSSPKPHLHRPTLQGIMHSNSSSHLTQNGNNSDTSSTGSSSSTSSTSSTTSGSGNTGEKGIFPSFGLKKSPDKISHPNGAGNQSGATNAGSNGTEEKEKCVIC